MVRTLVWTGANGTNFADAANWNDITYTLDPATTAPSAVDTILVDTGGGTITGAGTVAVADFSGLTRLDGTIDVTATFEPTFAQGSTVVIGSGGLLESPLFFLGSPGVTSILIDVTAGGTIKSTNLISPQYDPSFWIGAASGSQAAIEVSGKGASLDAGGWQVLVGAHGNGTLTISNGASGTDGNLQTSTGYFSTAIGNQVSTDGTLAVTGVGSSYSALKRMAVGDSGTGTLTITAGAHVDVSAELGTVSDPLGLDVGVRGYGSLDVSGSGSQLTVLASVFVGDSAEAQATVEAGATMIAGYSGAAYPGVEVGAHAGAEASRLLVTGAGSLVRSVAGTTVAYQSNGATLQVTNGATYTDSSYLAVAIIAGSSGSVSVDGAGSTIDVNYLTLGGGYTAGGSAVVSATNGGALFATSGSSFFQGGTLSTDSTGKVEVGGTTNAVAGAEVVDAGATVSGAGTIATKLIDNGIFTATGGTLEVTGSISGSGTLHIADSSVLRLDSTDNGAAIAFDGAGSGTLDLAAPNVTNALIGGFVPGSEMIVRDAVGGSMTSAVADGITTLTFTNGATTLGSLSVAGTPGLTFDAATGVVTACFAAGTRIATSRGGMAVEMLVPRDRVALARLPGRFRHVRWIGRRRLDCMRHPRPHDVWPVRVAAHAFGPDMPVRDLLLSPDHAVYSGGVLIPVRYLINGATIRQEPVAEVTYYHVELSRHDVLLAEGLPCESYLDTGNRAAFENGGTVVSAHPDFARAIWRVRACAPLVCEGPRLAATKATLAARLPMLGFDLTDDAALVLRADGIALEPQCYGEWWCVALPDGASRLSLRSRVTCAAHIDAWSNDTRQHGVALTEVLLDGEAVALDDPRLDAGWSAPEQGLRWSDGAAEIDVRGVRVVELHIGTWARYMVQRPLFDDVVPGAEDTASAA
jgi:collagen type I alpha